MNDIVVVILLVTPTRLKRELRVWFFENVSFRRVVFFNKLNIVPLDTHWSLRWIEQQKTEKCASDLRQFSC